MLICELIGATKQTEYFSFVLKQQKEMKKTETKAFQA